MAPWFLPVVGVKLSLNSKAKEKELSKGRISNHGVYVLGIFVA